MKKYQSQVPAGNDNVIGKLPYIYKQYEIRYSKDGSTCSIGDFTLEKRDLKDIGFAMDDRSLYKPFNAYYITFPYFSEPLNKLVDATNDCLLFHVLYELDKKCHAEFMKRQKREQLIASIKSFPGRIAKKLGLQR